MKVFNRSYANKECVSIDIPTSATINTDSITLVMSDEDNSEVTVTINSLPSGAAPHSAYKIEYNQESNSVEFKNLFKETLDNKTPLNTLNSPAAIGRLMIPYADASFDEGLWHINAEAFTLGEGVIEEHNEVVDETIFAKTMAEIMLPYLPSINLSKNGDTVTVQLKDKDNNNISRGGVEIFVEATTGNSSNSRVYTDANGTATFTLTNTNGSGKIKAGFKEWSGKTELEI